MFPLVGSELFIKAMAPALRIMGEHSKLVDRTKTEDRQTTTFEGTTATWEYGVNEGIGDERFCHKVVDMDWGQRFNHAAAGETPVE